MSQTINTVIIENQFIERDKKTNFAECSLNRNWNQFIFSQKNNVVSVITVAVAFTNSTISCLMIIQPENNTKANKTLENFYLYSSQTDKRHMHVYSYFHTLNIPKCVWKCMDKWRLNHVEKSFRENSS